MRDEPCLLFKNADEMILAQSRAISQFFHRDVLPEMLVDVGDRDETAMISPVDIYETIVRLSGSVSEEELHLAVCADGRCLVAYQPERQEIPKLPEPARAAGEPQEIMTNNCI